MLLDTSGLLCYIHTSEPQHPSAVKAFDAAHTYLTHSYVLSEFVALSQVRNLPRINALTFVKDLLEHPDIETIWVDEELHQEAVNLLLNRMDKTYSLCDAVSFVLMRRLGLTDALTTDRHFEQEGFVRLLTMS
ncbi:MAG: nucleic acid-binding protein [Pseudanabaena frigida]|uniref:Nucleic acid-binding protein n=1 Tax=Pseudanabaena frigida TaxID=945775 RepID=A0A2W4W3L9_9CYAN|nr:MAG: nucleic acid-binding protein [Pseudanabaena frigida]